MSRSEMARDTEPLPARASDPETGARVAILPSRIVSLPSWKGSRRFSQRELVHGQRLAPRLVFAVVVAVVPACMGCTPMAGRLDARAPAPPDRPVRILLTNDDGIDAAGLNVLRRRLEARIGKYEVTVVAPASNRSGSGMAKTRGDFGVIRRGPHAYAVLGTPADCVIAALGGILDERPDLVVSGMNDGANLGRVALSSGTVGAAMTAAIAGLPAIAVSVGGAGKGPDRTLEVFPDAAALTERIIESVMAQPGALGAGVVLSVNYPALPRSEIRGVRVVRQAALSPRKRSYALVRAPDLRHGRRRWAVTQTDSVQPKWLGAEDEDVRAFMDAWVTVTPMDGDWTDASKLGQFSDLLRALPSHAPRP